MAHRRLRVVAGALGRGAGHGMPGPFRLAVMLAATAGFALLLWHRLSGVDLGAVLSALAGIAPLHWGGALAATWISFLAIGRYDDAVHRHMATGLPAPQARRAGWSAIALSQFLGFGVLTGTLVRWRMLPSLGLLQAGRLTVMVSLMFLAGWALVFSSVTLAVGGPLPGVAGAVLLLGAGVAGFSLSGRRLPGGWPNLYTLGRIALLAGVDCLAAGLALWWLWPEAPGLALLLPAFLLALGAGLVSGSPGGIGAFEVTLLAFLPQVDEAGLVAAVLAWRGAYFLAPALLAGADLARGPVAARRSDALAPVPGAAAFPEAGLMRQGLFQPLVAGETLFAAARTAHALVALREPLSGCGGAEELRALMARAGREARAGVVYKAPPRLAAAARRAGLSVLPLAREAWLSPAGFAIESPEMAPLRRKLRKAAAAGVAAACEPPVISELARLSADWVAHRGGEMGFSMGRFEPGYVAGQRLYVARKGLRPVGFATFHTGPSGWSLDLLRPHPDAPDGTAHTLIAAAVADAARAGVARLSLAAVPEPAFAARPRGILGQLFRLWPQAAPAARGLRQFKQAFHPRWERLYLLAPGPFALALAGWDIRRAISRPAPLAVEVPAATDAPVQREQAIASRRPPWQIRRN